MFDWYTNLDWRIRLFLAIIVLAIATAPYLFADVGLRGVRGLAALYLLGFLMLINAFPTHGEKNKWGDW